MFLAFFDFIFNLIKQKVKFHHINNDKNSWKSIIVDLDIV